VGADIFGDDLLRVARLAMALPARGPALGAARALRAGLSRQDASATWLTAGEKRVLVEAIARDAGQEQEGSIVEALLGPRVWLTRAIYFCFVAGLYGVGFWLPTIISGMGVKSPTSDS
jgi:hypothetical protein